jgi:hypothetical protein
MITLGIRSKPDSVTFAIFNSQASNVINVEKVKIPKALSTPEALKYLRNTILDILREYSVEKAGIRITESNSKRLDIDRIQIEGVIQEAFASSNLASYYCGQISSISARIGINRSDFKRFVDGEIEFNMIENWGELNKEEREALFAAIGAVNA